MNRPSPICEVFENYPLGQCCEKAVAAYPAYGGGWMSLCAHHAPQHANIALPLEAIERGERHPWWDKYPAETPNV